MKLTTAQSDILKLLFSSLKIPIILLIFGYSLLGLTLINVFNESPHWNTIAGIMSELGYVISALGYVLFLYLASVSLCDLFVRLLHARNNIISSRILSVIKNGLRFVFVFIAIYTVLVTLEMYHFNFNIAHKVVIVFLICSVAWLVLQVLTTLEVIFYNKYAAARTGDEGRRTGLIYSKIHQIRNVAALIVVVVAVAASLMVFENVRSLGISILASAGFLTAILGIAAQKSLSSLFAGLQLALSQPFSIGDTVVVENEYGIIEEITLNYVIVRIWDSRRLLLPVNYFIEKPFINWSHGLEGLLGAIKLNVDYLLPLEPLRLELKKFVSDSLFWDKREAKLIISDFKENRMELSIIVSAGTPAALGNLLPEIREKILVFLRANYPDQFPKMRIVS